MRVSLSLSGKQGEFIEKIAEETGETPQNTIRRILWLFFEHYLSDLSISSELREDIEERQYMRRLNCIKFKGIKEKRRIFFLRNARKCLLSYRLKNNLSFEEIDSLMVSFFEEAKLYGLEDELKKIVEEEKKALSMSKGIEY